MLLWNADKSQNVQYFNKLFALQALNYLLRQTKNYKKHCLTGNIILEKPPLVGEGKQQTQTITIIHIIGEAINSNL